MGGRGIIGNWAGREYTWGRTKLSKIAEDGGVILPSTIAKYLRLQRTTRTRGMHWLCKVYIDERRNKVRNMIWYNFVTQWGNN